MDSFVSNAKIKSDAVIDAYLGRLATGGRSNASARLVARDASASASAINYYFGSIERLYCAAQAAAVERAGAWLKDRLAELGRHPMPAVSLAHYTVTVIDRWVREQRILAHAEAETVTALARSESLEEAAAWDDVWATFWREMLPSFSLSPDLAPIAHELLFSERFQHLADWNRLFDRAGLEEVCTRVAARLSGDKALLALATPWRERAEALCQSSDETRTPNEAGRRIARATLSVIDAEGETALTHRAVAAAAEVSLGAVAHHFPTRDALLTAAYGELYPSLVARAEQSAKPPGTGPLGEQIRGFVSLGRSAPGARAMHELFLAATRDPALADFAARYRYSRGRSTHRLLQPQYAELTRLDGLLISHWAGGASRTASLAAARGEPETFETLDLAEWFFRGAETNRR